MEAPPTEPRRAVTEPIFEFLGDVPWWIVIIAIVGLFVVVSVLSNPMYRDAMYFILDWPWDKDLVGEAPVEDGSWCFTPEIAVPLRPGEYRFYEEYNDVQASVEPEVLPLLAEPSADAPPAAQLVEGERVTFLNWHVVPKENLRPQQNWAFVTTDDGREGWALDDGFIRETYQAVGEGGVFIIQVPEEAEPGEGESIQVPFEGQVELETSTPTICGTAPAGVWVRLYDRFTLSGTISRTWAANGVLLTIRATLLSFVLALVLGLITSLMLIAKNPVLQAVAKLYVEVIRGIPMLVIILYAGFVLAPTLRDATDGNIELGRLTGAVLGLAFGYGAYLAEVFRAGIESIHFGQMEAARSLGMSYLEAMRHVILPQAIRVVLPPLGNDFIAMLKDSSLISVVALPEILQTGRLWVSRTFRAFEGYNTVALYYLLLTLVLSVLVRLVERLTALPDRSEE